MAPAQPHRHLLTTWLASLALLFAALMPMPGQNTAQPGGWAEMCTARGYVRVALEQPPDNGGSQQSAAPCLWCSLHCSQAQLPGSAIGLALFATPRLSPTVAETPSHHRRRTWLAALSRGPPQQA